MVNRMKIAVAGIGYVGLANAAMLAPSHEVWMLDIDQSRVGMVNDGRCPISDPDLERFFTDHPHRISATSAPSDAMTGADIVIIATPTNYDPSDNSFDTSSVEAVAKQTIALNPDATILIKSTIPVGYTTALRQRLGFENIIFSPEFLREGQALHDTLYPSRIIVGDKSERAKQIADLLLSGAMRKDAPVLLTAPDEAEAIKLFANTYLAMRVAYFNELDSFALSHNLDARDIIEGVCHDPRIGHHYNNPSFGYGGYCLPKDTKQLRANYDAIPQNLISAIIDANETRMDYLAAEIIARKPKCVGIYRLVMKSGSDNFRDSSIRGILRRLRQHNASVLIYEPTLDQDRFEDCRIAKGIHQFKTGCDLILANRLSEDLQDVVEKVFTRDLFSTG